MEERFRRYRSDRDLRRCGVCDNSDGYRSQWYQGTGAGMEWLRLTLEGVRTARVRVYAVDELPEDWDGSLEPALEPALERRAGDLLLYGVHGRFLCFTVTPAQDLSGYALSFPGRSIDAGLPDVMRGDEILRRFLGVYQSVYMDLNQAGARFPGRLDPQAEDALPELKYWLGAARWMRDTPQLPELLSCAPALNRMRGTRRALDLLLRVVTGGRGELVEYFQWQTRLAGMSAQERQDCARLYGADRNGAVLLLPEDTPPAALRFLENVLEDFIPLGASCSVLALQAGAPMDGHSYLDGNAELSDPPPPALDETDLDDLTLE